VTNNIDARPQPAGGRPTFAPAAGLAQHDGADAINANRAGGALDTLAGTG